MPSSVKPATDHTCFVLMPFTVRPYDSSKYPDPTHWTQVYEGLIQPAVTSAGLRCERDDRDPGSRVIVDEILRKIEDATIVLCDLSSHNPNAAIELGWAMRADRPFVLIKDELTDRTFDLGQVSAYDYKSSLQPTVLREDVDKLARAIRHTLQDTERRYSLVRRLSLRQEALQAVAGGDTNTRLLLEIQRGIAQALEARPLYATPSRFLFPWPRVLRMATVHLSAVVSAVRSLPKDADAVAVREIVTKMAIKRETRYRRDFQASVLDGNRTFLYHDWDGLVGARAIHLVEEGGKSYDLYDEVFSTDAGMVAWTDIGSNVLRPGDERVLRSNIGMFLLAGHRPWKVVLEAHHESNV